MITNWADHVVITIDGNTLENIYQEWIAYKREIVELRNYKERIQKMLKEQGEVIYKLKDELEAKEIEIQKLLSLIDNLQDDLSEYKSREPQYFYNG